MYPIFIWILWFKPTSRSKTILGIIFSIPLTYFFFAPILFLINIRSWWYLVLFIHYFTIFIYNKTMYPVTERATILNSILTGLGLQIIWSKWGNSPFAVVQNEYHYLTHCQTWYNLRPFSWPSYWTHPLTAFTSTIHLNTYILQNKLPRGEITYTPHPPPPPPSPFISSHAHTGVRHATNMAGGGWVLLSSK